MNQAIRKLSGLLVLPVLLAALLLLPVRANAAEAYECYAELPVSVELNGESDEQFHVTIDCGEGQPLPDEAADGLMIAGDASGVFHNFHFTEPGDYVYTVRQESADTEHMTYDGTVYIVTIRVTNAEGGGLQHEIWATTDDAPDTKVEELRFLNTYAPPVPTPETTPSAEPTPVPDPGHPDIADAIKDGTWGATPTPTAAPWFVPQTSDTFPLVGVLAVLIVAAVAIVALIVGKKRKGKQDNQ